MAKRIKRAANKGKGPSTSSEVDPFTRLFSSEEQQAKFLGENYNIRTVISPRYLDSQFLSHEGFSVVPLFKELGLFQFATYHHDYFEELIKVFICNLRFAQDVWKSEVKHVAITIRPQDWEIICGLRYDGTKNSNFSEFPIYDRDVMAASLLKPGIPLPNDKKVRPSDMTVDNRILHYIVARVLFPRGGNYAVVFDEDIFVMWLLRTKQHINWPFQFGEHILKVKRGSITPLPYALLIHKILLHYGVPFDGENIKKLNSECPVGLHTLNKMKLKKVNDEWVASRGSGSSIPASAPIDVDQGMPSQFPSSEPPPVETDPHVLYPDCPPYILALLTGMQQLQTDVTQTRTDLAALRTTVDGIARHLGIQPTQPPDADMSYAGAIVPYGVDIADDEATDDDGAQS